MQEIKGLLDNIRQHDKLGIRVCSGENNFLPAHILEKLIQPHRTAFYLFVFLDKGSCTHQVDLQNFTINEGQLLFVLPNQVHTPPARKSSLAYFKLVFDENVLALLPGRFTFLINPSNAQTITFDADARQRVSAIFETLNQLLHSSRKERFTELILVHFNTLLTELDHAYCKPQGSDSIANPKLAKYIAFKLIVETHLTEQHSVNEIAEKLSVTTGSLYGIVKEFSGISPKEFITSRLMLEAQRKLRYSKLSVKELAYALGFSDPDYFSRLFKKSTGKSVSRYLADIQDLSGN